jgi:hypothetical protein
MVPEGDVEKKPFKPVSRLCHPLKLSGILNETHVTRARSRKKNLSGMQKKGFHTFIHDETNYCIPPAGNAYQ